MNKKEKYSLNAHNAKFGTNQQCHDFLVQLRWKGTPTCPKCGNANMNYYLSTRKIYKCSSCYNQFNVTQKTIFEGSKIPLQLWFQAIYFFTTMKRGVSSVQMADLLDVSQKTAWLMLHKLREAVKDENNIILEGIVEADETSIGPQIHRDTRLMYKRRKHVEQQDKIHGVDIKKRRKQPDYVSVMGRPKGMTNEERKKRKNDKQAKGKRQPFEIRTYIFGMIENKGRVVMKKIGHSKQCISKEIIYPLLEQHVVKKSILITDELNLYNDTNKMFVEHLSVNHQKGFVINGIHTNNIENSWKHLGKLIDGTYFHISNRHFDRYLNENTYRYNRRNDSKKILFDSFWPLVPGKKITYRELTKKEETKIAA